MWTHWAISIGAQKSRMLLRETPEGPRGRRALSTLEWECLLVYYRDEEILGF